MGENEQTQVAASGRLLCPHCGGEMNLHAEKVDYGAAMTDPARADPVLGGVVEEFHACPACNYTVERPSR